MFPTRTRVLFISLKCHTSPYPTPPPPPSPYGFGIPVNNSWEFLVVVCLPVLKILTLFQTNVVIILLVVLLPGWISVWCNVVWRWWIGICHQQCDIWDHRTGEERFVSGLRGEHKLVWFFPIFKPFTGKGGQSSSLYKVYHVKLLLKRFHLNRVTL